MATDTPIGEFTNIITQFSSTLCKKAKLFKGIAGNASRGLVDTKNKSNKLRNEALNRPQVINGAHTIPYTAIQ